MADNTGNTQNPFDQMAIQEGKLKAPVASAPSQPLPEIPKPVASPYLDQQPQSGTVQAGNLTLPFHGNAADVQSHIIPPAQPESANPFDNMAAQQQAKAAAKNAVGKPPAHVAALSAEDKGALTNWWDDQSPTVSDTYNWLNKKMSDAYAAVGKLIPQRATGPMAADVKYIAQPLETVGEMMASQLEATGRAPADLVTGLKNKDYNQVAKALIGGRMSAEQQKATSEQHPYMAGVGGGVGHFAGQMVSPTNLAIMIAMPEAKAFPILSNILKAGFELQMGGQAMAQVADLAHNWGDMTREQRTQALTELPLNVGMMVWGALSGDKETQEKIDKAIRDKKTLVKPTTKTIAGVPRTIPAVQQEGVSGLTKVLTHEAEVPGMRTASDVQQAARPEGQRQFVSVLSQRATDKINAHDALAKNNIRPAEITGTQTPGEHTTPDQIWQEMQQSANQTYNKARDISQREQTDWQARRDAAEKAHREAVDRQNAIIDAHNADPENDPKLDHVEYDNGSDNYGLGDRPKTYDELKTDIDNARQRLGRNNMDTADRQRAKDVDLPKAEKAMDEWFKNHEDAVSPAEYQSAKDLWSDSERFKEIAKSVRAKLAKNTLTGNDIRGLEATINGKAIDRRGAAGDGTYQRLLGPEAISNLNEVAKLFDPLEPNDPRLGALGGMKSFGLFLARHAVATLLMPVLGAAGIAGGEAARLGMDMFMNHVMFDPTFGRTFVDYVNSVKESMANGAQVPAKVYAALKNGLQRVVDKYQESKFSSEKGAVGAAVKQARTGPEAGTSPKFPKPATPEVSPNADMRTAGVNYAEDLRAQQQAAEERDKGTLPEGMSFLQRAQQLKEQFVAEKNAPQPDNDVHAIANEYNAAAGRPALDTTKVDVAPNRADIADQFDEMKHEPEDPAVKQSYAALLDELKAQKKALEAKGYKFELSNTDPYSSYEEMRDDVLKNKRIKVWTGGNPLEPGHPLAEPIPGMKGWDGNTLLRAVHDVMGHVAGDNDFSEKGEENAYNLHKQAFSERALPALTTETKGQTSWFFNNKGVREGAPLGQFAQQKAGLLPEFLNQNEEMSSKELAEYANKNRGFTLNGREGFMRGQKGYSVAGEHPELDEVIPGQNVTPAAIEEYRNRPAVKEALKDPNNSLGGWFYKGNLHLEVSKLMKDRDAAIAEGKRLNQNTIFDHSTKSEIPTGGNAADLAAAAAAAGGSMQSMAAVAPAPDKEASEIPTRRPWAKNTEQGLVPGQHSNMEAFEQASENKPSGTTALGGEKLGYKEKMARTVSQYPGMFADENERLEALKDPDKVLNKFVNHLTDNLEWLYDQIPEEIRQKTRQWYDAANRILTEKANKYGFSPEQAAGVIARLSPQNPWDNNLHLADRMMDIYRNQQNHPYTDEMAEKSDELRKVPTQSAAFKKMLRDIKGKKLSEIKNADPDVQAALKGLWIRLFDEAHGPDQVPSVSPTGEIVGYGSKPSWIGTDHVGNAVKILENGDIRNIHDVMGDGHKIRNFYNNLINPNSPNGHVTIDTHATAAALLSPLGPKDAEAAHTFGGTAKGIPGAPSNGALGLTGSYPLYAEAYQRVAKKLGIKPRELQSAIWEGIKSLMGDEKKTGALKGRVKEIWEDAAAGKITPEQAREQIKDAAYGFSKPTWMSDEEWEKLGPEQGDTGFNPDAMQQMTSLGTEHSVTADVNPPGVHPELKGQPQPQVRRDAKGNYLREDLHSFANWANANDTPTNMLTATSHEVAHALVSHHMGVPTSDMKIGLGHRAIVEGEPMGEGLGMAPLTGVSGGFVHPGKGWKRAFDNAGTRKETAQVLKGYLTQLMAGRAAEELLDGDPKSVHEHAQGDIQMARETMASHGIPREEMGKFIDMATEKAKKVLQENWDTFQHITQQSVKHYGGDLIDSGTFHKYRNGGVYETGNPNRPEGGRTVNFVRNPQGAPNFGSRFAQDVEPAGRYISEVPEGTTPPKGWYAGTIHFKNPLVLEWGGGYQSGDNWKHRLSKRYGGKTGEALSEAIRKDGHDGIITVNPDGNTSEIVDLGRR